MRAPDAPDAPDGVSMTDTRRVSEELYAIAPARRRRMALVLAPVGLALLVAAILVIMLDGIGWKLAGLLVAVLAVVLLGVAWGLRRSAALTEAAEAERRLDQVLAAAAHSSGVVCGSAGSRSATHGLASSQTPAGSAGAHSSGDSTCGSTGLICGSVSAEGGCGASCVARAR